MRAPVRYMKHARAARFGFVAACMKAKSKLHLNDFTAMRRTGGRGNINSPFKHEADYFPSATPPEWAAETVKSEVVTGEGDLFDE